MSSGYGNGVYGDGNYSAATVFDVATNFSLTLLFSYPLLRANAVWAAKSSSAMSVSAAALSTVEKMAKSASTLALTISGKAVATWAAKSQSVLTASVSSRSVVDKMSKASYSYSTIVNSRITREYYMVSSSAAVFSASAALGYMLFVESLTNLAVVGSARPFVEHNTESHTQATFGVYADALSYKMWPKDYADDPNWNGVPVLPSAWVMVPGAGGSWPPNTASGGNWDQHLPASPDWDNSVISKLLH